MVSEGLNAHVRRAFAEVDADAAVVLLTKGKIERLEDSARIAERDWRDALVWSGLGHADWPERLDGEPGIGEEG